MKLSQLILSTFIIILISSCEKKEVEKELLKTEVSQELEKAKKLYKETTIDFTKYSNKQIRQKLDSALSITNSIKKHDTAFLIRLYRYDAQFKGLNLKMDESLSQLEKVILLQKSYSQTDTLKLLSDYHFISRYSLDNSLLRKALYEGVRPQKDLASKQLESFSEVNEQSIQYLQYLLNAMSSEYSIYQELGDFAAIEKWIAEAEPFFISQIESVSNYKKNSSTPKNAYYDFEINYYLSNLAFKLSEYYFINNQQDKAIFYNNHFKAFYHPVDNYANLVYCLRKFRSKQKLDEKEIDSMYRQALFHNNLVQKNSNFKEIEKKHYIENKCLGILSEITSRYAYRKFGDSKEAVAWYKKAIKLVDDAQTDQQTHPLFSINKLLIYYEKQEDPEKLRFYLDQFFVYNEKISQISQDRILLGYEIRYALNYGTKKEADRGLKELFKSYNINGYDINTSRDAYSKVNGIPQNVSDCLKIAHTIKRYNEQNPEHTIEVLPLYFLASAILKSYIGNQPSDQDIEVQNEIKENLLRLAYTNNKLTKDHLKMVLLSIQELQQPLLHKKLSINDLLKKHDISHLGITLEYLKNQIQIDLERLNNKTLDSDTDFWESQYALHQRELQNLVDSISVKAPNFHMVQNTDLDMDSFLKDMDQSDAIIKLDSDEKDIYAFILTKNNIDICYVASKKDYENILKHSRNSDFNFKKQNLLSETVTSKTNGKNFIKIIPDIALNPMPVEYLVSPEQVGSYITSINAVSKHNENQTLKAIVFRPDYNEKRNHTAETLVRSGRFALPYAKEETSHINKIFNSRNMEAANATKQNFLNEAPNYNMHHLAMHAVVNPENDNEGKLLFQGDKDEDYLKLNEIYNLNLDSELVTLSACNTAYGKVDPIEGTLSLSRAFQYAGARSTLTSLWRVPDRETSIIMKSFYTYLKDGDRKDLALKKAKQDYLENQVEEDLKHPYYWAGFIITGDTSPINFPTPWYYYLAIGLIIVMVLVLISLSRKRNKTNPTT